MIVAGALATGMALRPLGSVRQLRRIAVAVATLATVYLFVEVLSKHLPGLTSGSSSPSTAAAASTTTLTG